MTRLRDALREYFWLALAFSIALLWWADQKLEEIQRERDLYHMD